MTILDRCLPASADASVSWCVLSVSWRDRSPPKEGSYQHFCRENRVEVAGVEPAPVLPWVGWLEEISAGQRYYLPVRR